MNSDNEFHKQLNLFGDAKIANNVMVVNFQHRYIGYPDRVSYFHEKFSLVELKTISKPKKDYRYVKKDDLPQLSAYWLSLKSIFKIEQAALIYYSYTNKSWQEFLYTPHEMEHYQVLWIKKLNRFRQLELLNFENE